MNFKAHLIAGSIAGIAISAINYYFSKDLKSSIILGSITLAASLVPDIDTGSIPSRIFAWLGILVSCFLLYFKNPFPAAIIGIVYMAFSSDKHRGFTHKWALPICCFIASYLTKQLWLSAFGLGLIVHYVMDNIPPYKLI